MNNLYQCECSNEGCEKYISTFGYGKLKKSPSRARASSAFIVLLGHQKSTDIVLDMYQDLVLIVHVEDLYADL